MFDKNWQVLIDTNASVCAIQIEKVTEEVLVLWRFVQGFADKTTSKLPHIGGLGLIEKRVNLEQTFFAHEMLYDVL